MDLNCHYYHAGHCLKEGKKCSVEETGVCIVWLSMEKEWIEKGYVSTAGREIVEWNSRKGTLRQTVAGSILVGLGIALLWMFLGIYIHGKLYVWEPNPWILAAEIVLMVFIILFGLVRACNGIMREYYGRKYYGK